MNVHSSIIRNSQKAELTQLTVHQLIHVKCGTAIQWSIIQL